LIISFSTQADLEEYYVNQDRIDKKSSNIGWDKDAKELLKYRFICSAKKTSYLTHSNHYYY